MKELKIKIELVEEIKPQVYLLEFTSPYIAVRGEPGQFLHIKVDERITVLRRPFSIHRVKKSKVYVLFKVRGKGTKLLSQYKKGDTLDIIGPLGKGFTYSFPSTSYPLFLIVAGGMGVAPLVFLGERLREIRKSKIEGRDIAILGAKSKREILCEEKFKKLGYKTYVATEDGSKGFKGRVTDLLKNTLSTLSTLSAASTAIYSCGPIEMFSEMKSILRRHKDINCQVSLEQFMGCGLGVCCGCAIETKEGYKKVCKDGPVFNLRW
jgi:dihydroorotate dehydrogenase electron transfer subunit